MIYMEFLDLDVFMMFFLLLLLRNMHDIMDVMVIDF